MASRSNRRSSHSTPSLEMKEALIQNSSYHSKARAPKTWGEFSQQQQQQQTLGHPDHSRNRHHGGNLGGLMDGGANVGPAKTHSGNRSGTGTFPAIDTNADIRPSGTASRLSGTSCSRTGMVYHCVGPDSRSSQQPTPATPHTQQQHQQRAFVHYSPSLSRTTAATVTATGAVIPTATAVTTRINSRTGSHPRPSQTSQTSSQTSQTSSQTTTTPLTTESQRLVQEWDTQANATMEPHEQMDLLSQQQQERFARGPGQPRPPNTRTSLKFQRAPRRSGGSFWNTMSRRNFSPDDIRKSSNGYDEYSFDEESPESFVLDDDSVESRSTMAGLAERNRPQRTFFSFGKQSRSRPNKGHFKGKAGSGARTASTSGGSLRRKPHGSSASSGQPKGKPGQAPNHPGGGDDGDDDDDDLPNPVSAASNASSRLYEDVLICGTFYKLRQFRNFIGISIVYLWLLLPLVIGIYLRSQQFDEFDTHFNTVAMQFIHTLEHRVGMISSNLEYLSITANVETDAKDWPFVTIVDFERYATTYEGMLLLTSFHPTVVQGNKREWERYAVDQTSMDDPLQYPVIWHLDPNQTTFQVLPYFDTENRTYFPAWQYTTVKDTSLINGDLLNVYYPDEISHLLERSQSDGHGNESRTTLTVTPVHANPSVQEAALYENLMRLSDEHAIDEYRNEPVSWVFVPVYPQAPNGEEDTVSVAAENEQQPSTYTSSAESSMLGVISSILHWPTFLQFNSTMDNHNIVCVVENTCDDTVFSMELRGNNEVRFMGYEDAHDRGYDSMRRTLSLQSDSRDLGSIKTSFCQHAVHVYPSDAFQGDYITLLPYTMGLGIIALFIIVFTSLYYYDTTIYRQIRTIQQSSHENQMIVTQMFPQQFRPMLTGKTSHPLTKHIPKDMITPGTTPSGKSSTITQQPIADLFPNCTVCFIDVAGFDVWSANREPDQIFTLLEFLFRNMDNLARRRQVFKVETISDCYVAVTGLPDPQNDHAPRMARFARDCMTHCHQHIRILQSTLGRDTMDLRLRVGMHSGPVTAGVLVGEKARFQLFGDTINTASRMQSTGRKNRIQVSEHTADLLKESGKASWLTLREDAVHAKGKGMLVTYWLTGNTGHNRNVLESQPHLQRPSAGGSAEMSDVFGTTDLSMHANQSNEWKVSDVELANGGANSGGIKATAAAGGEGGGVLRRGSGIGRRQNSQHSNASHGDRSNRVVEWLSEILSEQLRHIIAEREGKKRNDATKKAISFDLAPMKDGDDSSVGGGGGGSAIGDGKTSPKTKKVDLDEITYIFPMPLRCNATTGMKVNQSVQLPSLVNVQLRKYVSTICRKYRKVPFHDLDHCAHVTMSAVKLLKRIGNYTNSNGGILSDPDRIHDMTYGIASNALVRFAVVFAALIHDVDHPGVPNGQLSNESSPLVAEHSDQCTLEQNSFQIAWTLLMTRDYKELVDCICDNMQELSQFRLYVVNLVISTEIFNPRLKLTRLEKWEQAFALDGYLEEEHSRSNAPRPREAEDQTDMEQKATMVLICLLQAADISPTMQSWSIYKKWNERLFQEMYNAHQAGRSPRDPSIGWFQSELWFFDNFVIPIAQKLRTCGVFGSSSSDCLTYARENKREWENRGEELVQEMVQRAREKHAQTMRSTAPEASAVSAVHDKENIALAGPTAAGGDGGQK